MTLLRELKTSYSDLQITSIRCVPTVGLYAWSEPWRSNNRRLCGHLLKPSWPTSFRMFTETPYCLYSFISAILRISNKNDCRRTLSCQQDRHISMIGVFVWSYDHNSLLTCTTLIWRWRSAVLCAWLPKADQLCWLDALILSSVVILAIWIWSITYSLYCFQQPRTLS